MSRQFSNPQHFKASLEARIHHRARERGTTVQRERMLLIFERLVARIDAGLDDRAILKGGLALEARLARARTTKDVDLRIMGRPETILTRLLAASRIELADYLAFQVTEHPERAENPRALPDPPNVWRGPYARLAAECRLRWANLDQVVDAARRFLGPLLAASPVSQWSPAAWAWTAGVTDDLS